MAHTVVIGAPESEASLNEDLKRAATLLAAFDAIVAKVDSILADPADERPAGGAVVQQHAVARGLPPTFRRFDRLAAERIRAALSRMIEVSYLATTGR